MKLEIADKSSDLPHNDECDHDIGYTFGYDGPSIFSVSTKNPTWEFDEGYVEEDENHGVVYWNFCPKCGKNLKPGDRVKKTLSVSDEPPGPKTDGMHQQCIGRTVCSSRTEGVANLRYTPRAVKYINVSTAL